MAERSQWPLDVRFPWQPDARWVCPTNPLKSALADGVGRGWEEGYCYAKELCSYAASAIHPLRNLFKEEVFGAVRGEQGLV